MQTETSDYLLMSRYRLKERLGGGGFGTVYRADQVAFGTDLREVAVKISKEPLTEERAREIFADALLLSRLSDECRDPAVSQGFVTIHDAGIVGAGERYEGHAYCVMELVRGGSLSTKLNARAIPLRQALHYMRQIMATVAFMHEGVDDGAGRRRPVLHRDLKPSNILLAEAEADSGALEVAKVSDFGLAVEIDPIVGWSEAAGDVSYQAPECFSELRSSPQSDVYSLGLIFYEMLTGAHPFAGLAAAIDTETEAGRERARKARLQARRGADFAALEHAAELRREPQLRAVIRRMLELDELDRYPDARAALSALQKAIDQTGGAPVLSSQVSEAERIRGQVARARALVASGDRAAAGEIVEQAMAANRDSARVPDEQMVASAYELGVELLLQRGELDDARRLAGEGYRRRPCRETCRAMALCYDRMGASQAARQAWAESEKYAPEGSGR